MVLASDPDLLSRQLAPGAATEDLARLALLNDLAAGAVDEPLLAGRWVKLVGVP